MNVIPIYILDIAVVAITLIICYIFKGNSTEYLEQHNKIVNSKTPSGAVVAKKILKDTTASEIPVAKINSKHTNIYSSKYKALKLSAENYNSNSLTNICFCSNLAFNAIQDSKMPLLIKIKQFVNFLSNIIILSFIPIILVFSIIYSSTNLTAFSYYVLLVSLILYSAVLIVKFLEFLIKSRQQKNILKKLETLNMFENDEISKMKNILFLQQKFNFAMFGAKLFDFLKLLFPTTTIFDKNKNV